MSIAEYFRHDTLVVSFVGYAKYLYPLSLIQSGKPLEVNLTVQATMLREILVDAAALNANQIMAKAIQSIGQNYPSGPFFDGRLFPRDVAAGCPVCSPERGGTQGA